MKHQLDITMFGHVGFHDVLSPAERLASGASAPGMLKSWVHVSSHVSALLEHTCSAQEEGAFVSYMPTSLS